MMALRRAANERGAELRVVEGGSHTKVSIGVRRTVIPRHAEINEITARAILRQMGVK